MSGVGSLLGIGLGYFLPWLIALGRKKRNTGAIFILNLFLGWTVIGWIGALVLALVHDKPISSQLAQTSNEAKFQKA